MSDAPSRASGRGDYSERTKFWVSHLVVIIGTVMGVNLAANAGFQKAVEFELVRSERDSYYLRSALLSELADNVERAAAWGEDFRSGNARHYIGHPEACEIDSFVWSAMAEQQGTFEIPAEILTPIRRYYGALGRHVGGITSNPPDPGSADALVDGAARMQAQTMPALKANIAALAAGLGQFGIHP